MGDHEDRLSNLEAALQGLKIVTSGMTNLAAKYPPLPKAEDKPTTLERISALEKAHKEFRIVGGQNVNVSGSLKTGFCVNNTCPQAEVPGFPQVIPTPPPTTTGACCINGACSILSEDDCTDSSGTYQGDGTDCDPDPCCTPCEYLGPYPYFTFACGPIEGVCYATTDCDCSELSCSDPVPCDALFLDYTSYCITCSDPADCYPCQTCTVNTMTCEQECSEDLCGDCIDGTIQSVSNQAVPC